MPKFQGNLWNMPGAQGSSGRRLARNYGIEKKVEIMLMGYIGINYKKDAPFIPS